MTVERSGGDPILLSERIQRSLRDTVSNEEKKRRLAKDANPRYALAIAPHCRRGAAGGPRGRS
jgi:hypothetical protein